MLKGGRLFLSGTSVLFSEAALCLQEIPCTLYEFRHIGRAFFRFHGAEAVVFDRSILGEILAIPGRCLYNNNYTERKGMMKRLLSVFLALWLLGGAASAAEGPEDRGFGDMRWGDSEKKISERYALRYLEETSGGGRLAAVNFTDFKEVMGVKGPLVVLAAFRGDHLVQVNVPLSTDSAEEADRAFLEYTEKLASLYGEAAEKSDHSALWRGRHTNIYVQKKPEGLLVSFIDARVMKQ